MKASKVRAAFARAIRSAKEKDDWGRAVERGELHFMGVPCDTLLLLDVIMLDAEGRKQVKGTCSLSIFNCGGELGISARGSIHIVVSDAAMGDAMRYFEVALADAKTRLAASAEFLARAERAQLEAAHPIPPTRLAPRPPRL